MKTRIGAHLSEETVHLNAEKLLRQRFPAKLEMQQKITRIINILKMKNVSGVLMLKK